MPCEWSRYTQNWKTLSHQKKEQAQWHCEECGKPCLCPGESWTNFLIRVNWTIHQAIAEKPGRYVLTVAHLDQDPGNNNPANLKALCTVCHLLYDVPFRAANRLAKLERKGQGNLFDLMPPLPAGHGKDWSRVQLSLRQVVEPASLP